MKNKRVLISGASIAGPALGYWLQRYGFDVTIIEISPTIRTGGYKIDIRGKAIEVVKKMGLYNQARDLSIVMLKGISLDANGEVMEEIELESMGTQEDSIEMWRKDLNLILYQATRNSCEYIFDTSVKSVKQDDLGVTVKFNSGESREFDILIGADGIHSNIRSLVFGNESLFSYNIGDYFVAICPIQTELYLERHEIFYSMPNRLFNIYWTNQKENPKALFLFRAPGVTYDYKNIQQQKEIVSKVYSDAKWKIPEMLKSMETSSDFYFDEVKQIRMKKWSNNRTILIGDAAFSPSLGSGQGTSLALIGAYILAGELMLAKGDHTTAFEEYEKQMRSFVDINQKLGETVMDLIIPKSQVEPWIQTSIFEEIQNVAKCIDLKNYNS